MPAKKVTYKSFSRLKGGLILLYLGTSIIVSPLLFVMLSFAFGTQGTNGLQVGAIIFFIALFGLYIWGFTKLVEKDFDKRAYEQHMSLRICFKIKNEASLEQLLDWINEQITDTEIRSVKVKIISQKNFGDFYITDSKLDVYSSNKISQDELKELFQNPPGFVLELAFI